MTMIVKTGEKYDSLYQRFLNSDSESHKKIMLKELAKLRKLLTDLRSLHKKKQVNESDDVQDNMVSNVKDALMFLKMSGQKQVPVNLVFNEFKKRGVVVSLQQLQSMFPPGSSGMVKNITNQYVEFGDDNSEVTGPTQSNKTSDEIVGDLANKAINKRV